MDRLEGPVAFGRTSIMDAPIPGGEPDLSLSQMAMCSITSSNSDDSIVTIPSPPESTIPMTSNQHDLRNSVQEPPDVSQFLQTSTTGETANRESPASSLFESYPSFSAGVPCLDQSVLMSSKSKFCSATLKVIADQNAELERNMCQTNLVLKQIIEAKLQQEKTTEILERHKVKFNAARDLIKELRDEIDRLQKKVKELEEQRAANTNNKDVPQNKLDSDIMPCSKDQACHCDFAGTSQKQMQENYDNLKEEKRKVEEDLQLKIALLEMEIAHFRRMLADKSMSSMNEVFVTNLKIQMESYETALEKEVERHNETKEKLLTLREENARFLNQLQAVLPIRLQLEEISATIDDNAEALQRKELVISALEEELAKLREENDMIAAYKAQAEENEKDFLAEKKTRQELEQRNQDLVKDLNRLQNLCANYQNTAPRVRGNSHTQQVRNEVPNNQEVHVCERCSDVLPTYSAWAAHINNCVHNGW